MADICIIKDKKFRERAKAFNISTDTLEHITYKYYEEKKSNDQNPSDTYIKAQLGEFSYVEENPKIAKLAKSIWDSKYSKPLSFDNEVQREKAKNAAEAIFPPQVILLYTDNQDKKVLTIRKPVAKLDIKYRKDFPDWHNYNDYLLIMGDAIPQNERQVEQKKTGPQPFTFNDGVTVTAPFKPNEQQVEALNAISDFINSDEVSMTLSGYAGTGKTSLMELIAAKMKKQHRKIVFTASTNKAAAVLKNRVKKAGFTAQTLNKVFGIQVEVDSSKPYDASNLVTLLKEADVSSGTVVVIDEASMINEENYSILNKIAKDNKLKIIYTGDKGQLAPVKETKISKVFRDKNRKVVTLTKVERTDDNAILKEATALRNGQSLSGESSFNSEGKGVAYIKPANKEGKRAIVKAFAPMLRKNPDFFRILAFTNKAVTDYNTAVRNTLGYHDSTPRVGEPIVGYSNWGAEYDRRTKQTTYRFINSESYNIVGIKPAHKVSYTLENGTKVELMTNTATIEDSDGKRQKVDIIDIKDNPQNLEAATILAREKSRLFSKAKTLPRREQPAVYREINAIEEFLFVNDNIKEGNRTLQNKTFDFGYAMTVHKSQGSTFTHVLVDDTDIAKARSQSTQTTSPDYDAFSSMVDNSDTIIEGTQTDGSGFDSASSDMQVTSQGNLFAQIQQSQGLNAQTINNQANETTNIRQQLEYVAVSRATDTVTIISNNVKTEDSPLNHIPKSSTQGSPNITTANRKEMAPQLTQQSAFDASKAEFYSGAADGADKAWGDEARRLGIKVTDYTRDSWNSLSQEWKNKLSAEYEEVARALARPVIPLGNKGDIEVRRDMMQADKADAIFAIGSIIKPGHKGAKYINKSNHDVVDGGTGYAVQRGIIREIPVYIFDQIDNQWKVWDKNSNSFIPTSEPTLTPHAATIGTRGINNAGRQAIRNILAKTVSRQTTQQNVPASYEGLIKPDAKTIFVFGSNPEGRHGAGAAKTAKEKFGAVYGQGEGLQGNAYALPTKDLRSKPLYSEDGGKTPVTMYRGYALTEDREAYNIEETVGKTAVDYDESLKGALYFTSSEEEAEDYAKSRTDKSPEPPTQENPQGRPINRHYTGDYAKVSKYHIAANAKVEHYADMKDYVRNGKNSTADVIVLDKGTMWTENKEYIVKNPNVLVYQNMKRSIAPEQITESIRKMYEVARQNPSKQFKVAYTNGLNEVTLNGYTGAEMIKMFKDAGPIPSNVIFSKNWTDHWNEAQSGQQQAIQQEKQKLYTLKQDLGGGEQATTEVQDAVKVAKKGMSFKEALAGQEAFFSKEEQAQIKQGLNGKNLQVMSVSRLTDPAFFSKEIVAFLKKNAEKPLNDSTRVTAIEIWSKHDGLPIKDILDACKKYRVAPMVSFSITGLGGTALEGGVMKYQDMLERVGKLIKNGTLNPATTTVRIDPILPGVTNMDDIKKIVETAKSYGIKKFVTSLVQSYGYTEGTPKDRKVISGINNALAAEGKTYDWDKYYGRDSRGKINFKPKQEVINEIGKVLLELDKDPEITIQTCAFGINGLKVSACLDPMIIERITGVDVLRKDGTYDRDTSRPECMCYGCHGDFFKGQNKKCYSSCAYCYAAHSGDNKLNYYNEDGTLKDNDYTRTERLQVTQQSAQQQPTEEVGHYVVDYSTKTVHHKYISTDSYKVQDLPRIERLKSVLERAGEQGGEHRIKYYQFKKIDELITKEAEERGDYREKATTSLLYKIYGDDLTGVYDYDKSSKELIVNDWVFDFLQVAQESPKEIATLVDFITDKYDKESTGIESSIQDYSDIITGINSIKNTQQQVKVDNYSNQAPMPEASFSEQTSQKVPLPGYEYFNDLYEDTEVDAAWKIPVLQDLDSQLSTENTENENLQILSQMDRVLQSPSQEDYEKAPTPQQEEINNQMKEYFKRNQQLNNLLDNNVGLSPSEIRSTAETIVNTLSDIITEIQQHPEKATEYWPTLKTDKDLSKLSRREIVEILSVNRVMELAKQRFENLKFSEDPVVYSLYDSRRLIEQHNLVMNNWEAVIRFAGDIFVANEGFGIKHNSKKGNYEVEEREYQGYDYDDYSSYQDPEATAEETDEQEHWQIEAKTISVINSMTEQIRMAIHNCYELDRNGNKILDKWGIPKRVNKIDTVKKILYWTNGTLNLNDMIARMEAQKERNPWVTQLTQRLTDKSGKEADFQSQFYTTMHRHFQLYGIGQYEDGHYKHKILNRHKALSDTIKGISTLFQMHQHPLFNRNSTINLESLKALEGWYNELETIRKKYKLMVVFTSGEDARGEYVTSNDLELSDSDIETATKAIVAASKMLGYVTTEEEVLPIINKDSIFRMTKALDYMLNHEGLKAQAKNNTKDYKPFEFKKENNIRGALTKFLQPMMDSLEETALNTIFEDGKMYQSNVIPSFLSQLFDSFAQSDENFKPWVESFYGNSQWFKKDGRWRTPWLATMMENPEARKAFEHHVQLNFNKHNYMRNLSPEEYTISCITNYFFKTTNEKNPDHTEAWFRVPLQSNKPSSEFIKFFSYRGIDYKKQIVSAMQEFFLQELDRIDTIRKRNKRKEDSDYISSWDENGRHFMFLPFLNSYLIDNKKLVSEEGNDLFHNEDGTVNVQKNNELKNLLNEKLQAEQSMKPEKDMRLLKLVEEATSIYMQNRADQILAKYEKNGILKAAEKVENINDYGRSVRDNLENFLWNDFFAANNILQLTITDKAFYPTTAELQKRLAELHAPGVKANKYATDYGNPEKGIPAKRVSDGIYRTILISDYEGFTANIIDNLTEIFNRRIEQAPQDEKQAWVALKESLVGENGRYRNINVTDSQAYSSPASYRKKMIMFGKWSQEAEELYQKIRSGNYSLDDIRTVFQPLKPFVYGHLHKKTGVQKAPIQEMNVPFQAKNSEYLLLMADALIQGEKTGRPNILRAIYDIMEESEQLFPTKGIDTVQFKSAIKSGAQGIIHLSDFTENPAGEEMARAAFREQMYIKDDSGKIVDYNYDTFVQSTDYDNYALQQEVPKHFQEHWQAEPSQKRANIMSDLDMWMHKLTAQEFRRKYEEVHAQNIEESFDELTKLFKLDSDSKIERNIALSELLQEEIESSPRYGIDLLQACQIDPKTGEFRIPKGDPIQSKRIEQLINSIIKNRVNKQKLAGGPIVQVTNWGTSRQLHIRFNDKKGNLLETKEEYEQQSHQKSYQEYIKENQVGIAYFEIFAPASWKKHLEKFRNPDGTVNFEAIERCDTNLLKMITSRIPNEDKYSIAHGKIVGFTPEVAGEVIMFPYELTEIDDSDFDVDKRYCHVFEIEDIVEKDWNEISDSLLQKGQELYQQYFHTNIPERNLQGIIDAMVKNPQKFPTPNEFRKDLLTYYMGVRYEVKYPKKGTRADRNNQILNMDWAVLSNEMTASKILNPGGFDVPKHDAYVIAVYKAKNGTVSWETLEGKTTKQLQKMMPADGDLAWFDTQVQFYKQNAAGSNLIGVFAVNKVAHAFLEADDILIDVDDVCGEGSSFNIADKEFTGRIELDPARDSNGAYIGKGLGSMVGASADTAKDPWLDLIGINMTTSGVYNTLLRLGMPQKDAALFMSQDVLVTALEEFNRTNMEEPVTFDSIISKKIMTIGGKYGYNQDSEINREPLTRGELKYGLLHDDNLSDNVRAFKDKIDYKVLLAFSNLQRLASAIRKPTFVTRLNSISSAVGPLVIDNIILEHKLKEFLESENLEGTGFYSSDGTHLDMDDLLSNHPMLRAFSKAIDSREPDCLTKILFADMPAGSTGFKGLIEAFPDNIKDNLYKNRQLLSKLSDFYQSYMLVANGIINPAHIGDYIKKFPEYFVAKRIKEKYPDNAFIQAIQPFKKNGQGFLNTETTGMTEQEKERLRMAWTDLHKVNPTLSKQLLTYAFFRRGIGFSPETWTDLLSVYVKEHITSDNKNGSSVSYVDTYRHFPTNNMVESIIMEQFIRNNWNDSRIVPVKGGEGTYYDYSHLDKGILYVHSKKDKDNLQGIQFMRTTVDKKTYLWKRITPMEDTDSSIEFQRIMPLGNNGEYIEMSLNENMKALEEVDELKQNDEQPELPDNAQKDAAISDDSSAPAPIVSTTEQAKSITDIVKYMITSRNLNEKIAVDYVATLHKKAQDGTISKFSKQDIQRIAKDNGLNLDVDAALEWFKSLC